LTSLVDICQQSAHTNESQPDVGRRAVDRREVLIQAHSYAALPANRTGIVHQPITLAANVFGMISSTRRRDLNTVNCGT
jgi:hypothetical protein